MKEEFPEDLNRFRLREGPMGTGDDDLYEGCFVIPSPYDRFTTFQVKSSELPDPFSQGESWEHVSIIVKREVPKGKGNKPSFEQRQPDRRELLYLLGLFWDRNETPAQFVVPADREPSDHRILHLWRPATGGFIQLPESYREDVAAPEGDAPDLEPTMADISKARQEAAENRAQDDRDAQVARMLHDLKRLLELAERSREGGDYVLRIPEGQFRRLESLLGIE